MVCESCGEKSKKGTNDFTKAVVEINNPESLVLLRKVVIPASMGDDTDIPASIGKYRNVLLHYDANGRNYIYSSDGIPTALDSQIPPEIYERIEDLEEGLVALDNSLATVAKTGSYTDLTNTPSIPTRTSDLVNDGADGTSTYVEADEMPVVDSSLSKSSTNAIQNKAVSTALDNSVMTGVSVSANTSTTTVQLDGAKKNLYTGTTATDNIPLPVASTTQAGVMNSSTYDAITNNTSNISALMNGAVAITGLSASPSQSDLTTAWQTETGLTTLMNRAGIYDVSNDKVWTYYSNTSTWYAASNTSQVTINTFTNSSEGTIKGSTNVGQIFAENDGTGSVNGWDTLSGNVSTLQTSVAGKQDALTAGDNISISDQNVISATDTTYTAGNAIDITSNVISADIHPADFFSADNVVRGEGSNLVLSNTLGATLAALQVGGDTKQTTYSGKNLSPYPYYSGSSLVDRGITFAAASDGSVTLDGTNDNAGNSAYYIYNNTSSPLQFEAGTYYFIPPSDTNVTYVMYDGTSYYNFNSSNNYSWTFPSAKSIRQFYVQVYRGNTAVFENLKIYPMLTTLPNQTEADYEPYVGGISSPNPDYPQDVNVVTGEQVIKFVGKNLLGNNPNPVVSNGITTTRNADGSYTLTGTTTDTWSTTVTNLAQRIPAGTYTMSVSNPQQFVITLRFYDADGTRHDYQMSAGDTSMTVTVDYEIYRIAWFTAQMGTNRTYDTTFFLQLEKNSSVTAYESYHSNSYTIDLGSIELCKVGNYQDYIYQVNGEWYIHKATKKVTLTGSEVWENSGTNIFACQSFGDYATSGNLGYSTIAQSIPNTERGSTFVTESAAYSNCFAFGNGTVADRLYWKGVNFANASAFKTWLGSNNQPLYYALATPTDTKITDADLIAQLKALWGANSYTDTTYITVTATGSNLPALLSVGVYRKSLAGILGNSEAVAEKLNEVPEMPTVNDATLTIQQNGTNVATFTANSATNATANITSPVITMSSTDPGEGSALAANNFIGVYGGDPIVLDYSTSEQDTGATWIDGSHIYKKTVNFGTLPSTAGSAKGVAHSISNLGKVIKIEGYVYNGVVFAALPWVSASATPAVAQVTINSTSVLIVTNADLSSFTESYVTLYYTKSS